MIDDVAEAVALQHLEVVDHAGGDQHPEDGEELALLEQVGLAGLPDDVGDVAPWISCTGRALVCLYCTRPKTAPMAHIRMPRYISVTPLTPPRPANVTCVRSGILMSASLANAFVARPDKQNNATIHVVILIFLIGILQFNKCHEHKL